MKISSTFLLAALVGITSPALAGTTVYVPMGSANEVLVIDAAQDKIVGKIGDVEEAHGLAGTPDGKHLVAGSYAETRVKASAAPPKPKAVSKDEHGAHHAEPAKVTTSRSGDVSFASIIQTGNRKVVRRVTVPGAVHHTEITPDGRYAVMTHPNDDAISVIDLAAFNVVRIVPTGLSPNYAVAGKDGKSVYVSNSGNNTISEVDTGNWYVRRNILVGDRPEHLALSRDGKALYVNNVDDGTVSVISLDKSEVVNTYPIGGEIHGIDLSDDGKTLFVAGQENNKLVAVDLDSGKTRSVPLAPAPYHLTAVRGTGKLYVSSAEENIIWVVDQETLTIRSKIPVPDRAHQMVVVN